jgi:hypothetical protein
MNKQIHIRDVDAATHEKLVKQAGSQNQSLSEYLRVELDKIVARQNNAAIFDRLQKIPRGDAPESDTVAMIRELREERTDHLADLHAKRHGSKD